MRLFLSDTFYEAVLSLPKKIQSKVIAFQKKFRENNASNGIHLEPIAQFKDNALRSARVMIIIVPSLVYWVIILTIYFT